MVLLSGFSLPTQPFMTKAESLTTVAKAATKQEPVQDQAPKIPQVHVSAPMASQAPSQVPSNSCVASRLAPSVVNKQPQNDNPTLKGLLNQVPPSAQRPLQQRPASDLVAMVRPLTTSRPVQKIWEGELSWRFKTESQSVGCIISSQLDDNGHETVVKAENWPPKLMMQLIPKSIVSQIGETSNKFFCNAKSVLFNFPVGLAVNEQPGKILNNGYAGCVHLGVRFSRCLVKPAPYNFLHYRAAKSLFCSTVTKTTITTATCPMSRNNLWIASVKSLRSKRHYSNNKPSAMPQEELGPKLP